MILAEAVSIDGGVIALILSVILVWFATCVGFMIWGCKLAVRAGRGSRPDVVRWALVAAIGLLLGIPVLPVALIALAVQAWLFGRERSREDRTGGSRDPAAG